jgi:hypothetical protein
MEHPTKHRVVLMEARFQIVDEVQNGHVVGEDDDPGPDDDANVASGRAATLIIRVDVGVPVRFVVVAAAAAALPAAAGVCIVILPINVDDDGGRPIIILDSTPR